MTTQADGAALHAAILADPADDLARLAWADWLEETGGDLARSQFVRVQVELARLAGVPCSVASGAWVRGFSSGDAYVTAWRNSPPGRCVMPYNEDFGTGICHKCAAIKRLEAREADLKSAMIHFRDEHGRPGRTWAVYAWVPPVMWKMNADHWTFSRGFVSEVRCALAEWLECGPAVAKAHPLERVTLTDREPSSAGAAGGPPDGFFWNDELKLRAYERRPGVLPRGLFARLVGGDGSAVSRRYRTLGDTLGDLSAACIAWARLPEGER